MYALREREGSKAKAYTCCFYMVILLFESVQGGRGCLKITKFERKYFIDVPLIEKVKPGFLLSLMCIFPESNETKS